MTVTRPTFEFPVEGAGGEPVDLWRTFLSHGAADLPPMSVDESAHSFEVTLPTARGRPRTVTVTAPRPGLVSVIVKGRRPSASGIAGLTTDIGHIFRLDEDLSEFYELVSEDPDLAWAASGAGRMIRSASAFEDVVKTICTTNCAWSATERMVREIVRHLGEPAPTAPEDSWRGRAFPSPEAMAEVGEDFYRQVARAGYRGRYLAELSRAVADDGLNLEVLARSSPTEIDDDEVEARLRALPGVGPYAAAHIMMMFGRYSRLILDSWTRPKYARLVGRKTVSDATIARRFRRYGRYAGLAFWLFLTRDWVAET